MTVPGSGTLSPQERVLTARVHTMVGLAPDTVMVKPLTPGSVDRYLRGEVSAGVVGARPPFDFRLVGGTVARHQDCVNLRSPGDFVKAFRLDYPGSPFRPDLAVLHTMEFPALFPDHYVVPFGAPSVPTADKRAVREAAYAMVDAVKMAGVDPNTYRQEIAPWPYSGTGLTAGGDLAMPEWWKRPGIVPVGARIVANGAIVAVFRGASMGWEGQR